MPQSKELVISRVNLILGPRGIKLDERGRIRFVEPEILQALVSGSGPEAARLAEEPNYVQCGCNNVQCGAKRFAETTAAAIEVGGLSPARLTDSTGSKTS